MHEESGRWDELSDLWKRAGDREKILFLVIIGTVPLGAGLVGIRLGLPLGVGVFCGLPGLLMFSLAIAIWRKRQIQKAITPRWYGLLGKGIAGGMLGGVIGVQVGFVVGGGIENIGWPAIGAALGIAVGFAVGIGIAHLGSKF